MSDRTMTITPAYLLHAGMAAHAVTYFRLWYPRGVEVTEEFARRDSYHFLWVWLIQNVLEGDAREAADQEQQEAHAEQARAYSELEEWWEAGNTVIETYNDRSREVFNACRLRVALAFVAGFIAQGGRPLLAGERKRTSNGVELTDRLLDELAEEAERGYDIATLCRREGRKPL